MKLHSETSCVRPRCLAIGTEIDACSLINETNPGGDCTAATSNQPYVFYIYTRKAIDGARPELRTAGAPRPALRLSAGVSATPRATSALPMSLSLVCRSSSVEQLVDGGDPLRGEARAAHDSVPPRWFRWESLHGGPRGGLGVPAIPAALRFGMELSPGERRAPFGFSIIPETLDDGRVVEKI